MINTLYYDEYTTGLFFHLFFRVGGVFSELYKKFQSSILEPSVLSRLVRGDQTKRRF